MGKERQRAHSPWAPGVTSKRVENAPLAMPLAHHRQQWASDSTARREGQPRLSVLLPTGCVAPVADCAECASNLLRVWFAGVLPFRAVWTPAADGVIVGSMKR